MVRRCVWSRNLKNEEAMTRVGSQRHSKKNVIILKAYLLLVLNNDLVMRQNNTDIFQKAYNNQHFSH